MAVSLAENFDQYFEIKLADTQSLKNEAYRIRHTVYAQELGWEPISSDGLEVDEFDPYAFSLLLVHKGSRIFAGTVRLIIPPVSKPQLKLPFEVHFAENLHRDVINPATMPRGSFGEISRLSVPNQFRRRLGEKNTPFVINELRAKHAFSQQERRNFPNIAIGLYLSVIAMVNMCNHRCVFVVVEPRLSKRLQRLGLHFHQCADEMDYHGIRALFYLPSKGFTGNLNAEVFQLYQLLETQLQKQINFYPYAKNSEFLYPHTSLAV